jgi:methylthioribose-1-phosphate isomerase
MSSAFEAIVWQDGKIILLDQTKIPISETYNSYDEVAEFRIWLFVVLLH